MQRVQQVVRHLSVQPAMRQMLPVGRRFMSTKPAAASAEPDVPPVRVQSHPNGCLSLSLHRPKALNSLNLTMIRALTAGLKGGVEGGKKPRVALVYGEGDRAFCAGGDIRALAFPTDAKDPSQFFREEYQLNHLVASYPAPYVALMRGITMGGGVGISVHGRVRVLTDNTVFAMPETGIGLFPDVGGSYFLPRLQGGIGMYLALTGQSLGAADTLYAGVGTHFIPLASIPAFISALETSSTSLDDLLSQYATQPPADKPETKLKSFLSTRRAPIDRVFGGVQSYEEVEQRLEKEIKQATDEDERKWLSDTQKQLASKSPTSLLITFELMQRGAQLSLSDCLSQEFRVATRISLEGKEGDFSEGVHSVLIDKKHKPQWKPRRTPQQIRDTYFAPLPESMGIPELKL